MDEPSIVEELDPEDAFAILADETRIDVLRALWEADGQEATFSELRETVGVRDSGQFNYHLGKLTGRFVDKTDEGYELRTAGQHVVGSLLAGSYTMTADVEPIALEDPCPVCDGDLSFAYDDERVRIDCATCSYRNAFPVPPGAFADYPTDRFPSVADRYVRTLLARARNGFCAACEGRVRPSLTAFEDLESTEPPPTFGDLAVVVYDCDRCGMGTQINLSTIMLSHPRVSAFHLERGLDVREVPLWQLGAVDGEPQSTMLEDDPPTARVTYAVTGEELTLTVDGSLAVVDVDRS